MGPDSDFRYGFRNFHIRQTSGERLFINMGMIKRAGPKNSAVGDDHIPLVGIVIPALICVTHRYLEKVDLSASGLNSYFNNICFACPPFFLKKISITLPSET